MDPDPQTAYVVDDDADSDDMDEDPVPQTAYAEQQEEEEEDEYEEEKIPDPVTALEAPVADADPTMTLEEPKVEQQPKVTYHKQRFTCRHLSTKDKDVYFVFRSGRSWQAKTISRQEVRKYAIPGSAEGIKDICTEAFNVASAILGPGKYPRYEIPEVYAQGDELILVYQVKRLPVGSFRWRPLLNPLTGRPQMTYVKAAAAVAVAGTAGALAVHHGRREIAAVREREYQKLSQPEEIQVSAPMPDIETLYGEDEFSHSQSKNLYIYLTVVKEKVQDLKLLAPAQRRMITGFLENYYSAAEVKPIQSFVHRIGQENIDEGADPMVLQLTPEVFTAAGPVFVKILQRVITASAGSQKDEEDMLPAEKATQWVLERTLNNVQPMPQDQWDKFAAAHRDDIRLIDEYAETDPKVASVGEVHMLPSEGRVLKVIKPFARDFFKQEREYAKYLFPQGSAEKGYLDNVVKSIEEEFQVAREVANTKHAKQVYTTFGNGNHGRVKVVEIIGTDNKDFMEQEMADGMSLADMLKTDPQGCVVVEPAVQEMLALWFRESVFESGFFHSDMHPGNLIVDMETGILTVIDVGAASQLTQVEQRTIQDTLSMHVAKKGKALVRKLMSLCGPEFSDPKLEDRIQAMYDNRDNLSYTNVLGTFAKHMPAKCSNANLEQFANGLGMITGSYIKANACCDDCAEAKIDKVLKSGLTLVQKTATWLHAQTTRLNK